MSSNVSHNDDNATSSIALAPLHGTRPPPLITAVSSMPTPVPSARQVPADPPPLLTIHSSPPPTAGTNGVVPHLHVVPPSPVPPSSAATTGNTAISARKLGAPTPTANSARHHQHGAGVAAPTPKAGGSSGLPPPTPSSGLLPAAPTTPPKPYPVRQQAVMAIICMIIIIYYALVLPFFAAFYGMHSHVVHPHITVEESSNSTDSEHSSHSMIDEVLGLHPSPSLSTSSIPLFDIFSGHDSSSSSTGSDDHNSTEHGSTGEHESGDSEHSSSHGTVGELTHAEVDMIHHWLIFDLIISLVLIADMWLHIRSDGILYRARGSVIGAAVTWRSKLKYGVAREIIASLPWEIIVWVAGYNGTGITTGLFLRCFRLLYLPRITRYYTWLVLQFKIRYPGMRMRTSHQRLVHLFLWLQLIFHWVGCLWYITTLSNQGLRDWYLLKHTEGMEEVLAADTGGQGYVNEHEDQWVTRNSTLHGAFLIETWRPHLGAPCEEPYKLRDCDSTMNRYYMALYFSIQTICTVGYGDIVPHTPVESFVTILIMLLGVAMCASVVASITASIVGEDAFTGEHEKLMSNLNKYIKLRGLPENIQTTIRGYYQYLMRHLRGAEEASILNDLPLSLRKDVVDHLIGNVVRGCAIFRGLQTGFISSVMMDLEPLIIPPGHFICRDSEIATQLYFIRSGQVHRMAPGSTTVVISTLGDGALLGELSLLTTDPQWSRYRTCKAVTYVELFVLKFSSLEHILTKYPENRAVIQATAEEQRALYLKQQSSIGSNLASKKVQAWYRTTESKRDMDDDRWIILPDSSFRFWWDVVAFLWLMYYQLVVPYRLAIAADPQVDTDHKIALGEHAIYMVWDYIADGFFIINMILSYRCFAYESSVAAVAITDRHRIAERYKKRDLWVDVMATFPFEIIAAAPTIGVQYIPFFRVTKLVRSYHLASYFRNLERFFQNSKRIRLTPRITRLIRYMVLLLLTQYWMSWLWCYSATLPFPGRVEGSTWRDRDVLDHHNNMILTYMRSMYHTVASMVTLSTPEITALDDVEIFVDILIMVLGMFIMPASVGYLMSTAENLDIVKNDFDESKHMVRHYLHHHSMPHDLQQKVVHFYDFVWQQGGVDEDTVLAAMPHPLRLDIATHLYSDIVKTWPLLKGCEDEFISELCALLRLRYYPAHHDLCVAGRVDDAYYYIMKGSMKLLHGNGGTLDTLKEQAFFGATDWLQDGMDLDGTGGNNGLPRAASHTVRAAEASQLLTGSKRDTIYLLARYPKSYAAVMENVMQLSLGSDARKKNFANEKLLNKMGVQTAAPAHAHGGGHGHGHGHGDSGVAGVIAPTSRFAYIWTCICLIFTVYNCFAIPFRAAFLADPDKWAEIGDHNYILVVFDYLGDVWFIADIIFNHNYLAFVRDGDLVLDRAEIGRHYRRGWMIVDILSCLPLDLIAIKYGIQATAMFRFNRLLRFGHVLGYFAIIEHYLEHHMGTAIIRFLELVYAIIQVTHWFACMWFFTAFSGWNADNFSWTQQSWVHKDVAYSDDGAWEAPTSWQYMRSVYWALGATIIVFCGDVLPGTMAETSVMVAVLFIGILFHEGLIAQLAAFITNGDHHTLAFYSKLSQIETFVESHHLPPEIKQTVNEYYQRILSHHHAVDPREVYRAIPASFKGDVLSLMGRSVLSRVNIFHGCDPAFINYLIGLARPQFFIPGQYIYRAGEMGNELLLIHKGKVERLATDEPGGMEYCVQQLVDGMYFGDSSLLRPQQRTSSMRAVTFVDVFILNSHDVDKALQAYPGQRLVLAQTQFDMEQKALGIFNQTNGTTGEQPMAFLPFAPSNAGTGPLTPNGTIGETKESKDDGHRVRAKLRSGVSMDAATFAASNGTGATITSSPPAAAVTTLTAATDAQGLGSQKSPPNPTSAMVANANDLRARRALRRGPSSMHVRRTSHHGAPPTHGEISPGGSRIISGTESLRGGSSTATTSLNRGELGDIKSNAAVTVTGSPSATPTATLAVNITGTDGKNRTPPVSPGGTVAHSAAAAHNMKYYSPGSPMSPDPPGVVSRMTTLTAVINEKEAAAATGGATNGTNGATITNANNNAMVTANGLLSASNAQNGTGLNFVGVDSPNNFSSIPYSPATLAHQQQQQQLAISPSVGGATTSAAIANGTASLLSVADGSGTSSAPTSPIPEATSPTTGMTPAKRRLNYDRRSLNASAVPAHLLPPSHPTLMIGQVASPRRRTAQTNQFGAHLFPTALMDPVIASQLKSSPSMIAANGALGSPPSPAHAMYNGGGFATGSPRATLVGLSGTGAAGGANAAISPNGITGGLTFVDANGAPPAYQPPQPSSVSVINPARLSTNLPAMMTPGMGRTVSDGTTIVSKPSSHSSHPSHASMGLHPMSLGHTVSGPATTGADIDAAKRNRSKSLAFNALQQAGLASGHAPKRGESMRILQVAELSISSDGDDDHYDNSDEKSNGGLASGHGVNGANAEIKGDDGLASVDSSLPGQAMAASPAPPRRTFSSPAPNKDGDATSSAVGATGALRAASSNKDGGKAPTKVLVQPSGYKDGHQVKDEQNAFHRVQSGPVVRTTPATMQRRKHHKLITAAAAERKAARSGICGFDAWLPGSKKRHIWDTVALLMLIYNLFAIPYHIAFVGTRDHTLAYIMGVIFPSLIADTFFITDVFMRFFHFLEVHDGILITTRRGLAHTYWKRGGLIYDLIASLPIDVIAYAATNDYELYFWLRCMKAARITKISMYFAHTEHALKDRGWKVEHMLARIVETCCAWLLIGHWFACLFYFVARVESQSTEHNWFYLQSQFGHPDPNGNATTYWYVRAMYWVINAMSTTGYGDMRPRTAAENIIVVLLQLVSSSLYATLVGGLTSLIKSRDAAANRYEAKMWALKHYMKQRELPDTLTRRITAYYDYLWQHDRGVEESVILNDMPDPLRNEIIFYRTHSILDKMPLFQGCQPGVTRSIAMVLNPVTFPPGDFIVVAGEIDQEMYYIDQGSVEVVDSKGIVRVTLGKGSFFGELALLTGDKRSMSVRVAKTGFCKLFVLAKYDFEQVLAYYPGEKERLLEYITKLRAEKKILDPPKTTTHAQQQQQPQHMTMMGRMTFTKQPQHSPIPTLVNMQNMAAALAAAGVPSTPPLGSRQITAPRTPLLPATSMGVTVASSSAAAAAHHHPHGGAHGSPAGTPRHALQLVGLHGHGTGTPPATAGHNMTPQHGAALSSVPVTPPPPLRLLPSTPVATPLLPPPSSLLHNEPDVVTAATATDDHLPLAAAPPSSSSTSVPRQSHRASVIAAAAALAAADGVVTPKDSSQAFGAPTIIITSSSPAGGSVSHHHMLPHPLPALDAPAQTTTTVVLPGGIAPSTTATPMDAATTNTTTRVHSTTENGVQHHHIVIRNVHETHIHQYVYPPHAAAAAATGSNGSGVTSGTSTPPSVVPQSASTSSIPHLPAVSSSSHGPSHVAAGATAPPTSPPGSTSATVSTSSPTRPMTSGDSTAAATTFYPGSPPAGAHSIASVTSSNGTSLLGSISSNNNNAPLAPRIPLHVLTSSMDGHSTMDHSRATLGSSSTSANHTARTSGGAGSPILSAVRHGRLTGGTGLPPTPGLSLSHSTAAATGTTSVTSTPVRALTPRATSDVHIVGLRRSASNASSSSLMVGSNGGDRLPPLTPHGVPLAHTAPTPTTTTGGITPVIGTGPRISGSGILPLTSGANGASGGHPTWRSGAGLTAGGLEPLGTAESHSPRSHSLMDSPVHLSRSISPVHATAAHHSHHHASTPPAAPVATLGTTGTSSASSS